MAKSSFPFLSVHLQLKETDKQIEDKILNALRNEVNRKLNWTDLANKILLRAKDILGGFLRVQPEYASLINATGELRTQLGLANNYAIEPIITTWINGITVRPTRIQKRNGQLIGKIILTGIPKDLHDVLAMGQYNTAKGETIPWLDWLLNAGDVIIISTHTIGFYPPSSRTNSDVMVKSTRGWRVPPQYSGTTNNNYVTRAIDEAMPQLSREIEDIIRRKM